MSLHPVIMAGGSGTRFWPLSRQKCPKQFLALASGTPLIVETLTRLAPLATAKTAWVVCGKVHAPRVKKLLPEVPVDQVLVEPVARNTAPAIGLAALHVSKKDPDGILLVLPSDHHIGNPARFRETLATAASLANDGTLVTIGIKPSRPETGYGYIHLGTAIGASASNVQRFVEKPDLDRARAYLASGDYLWNAGIFAFRADVILGEIRTHLPKLAGALDEIGKTVGTRRYAAALAKYFPVSEPTSVDYGVMERASNIACVPGDFGWSDVGSFAALPEVRPLDGQGNVVQGEATLVDCTGSVVVGHGQRVIAALGLENIIIVDTGDVLLVLPKDRAQDVRKVVDVIGKRTGGKRLL